MDTLNNSISLNNKNNEKGSLNSFTIRGNRIKKFPVIILIAMLSSSFIAPIVGVIILIIHNSFRVSFIFSFLIFWGIGFYWLKLLLWNLYGKETITLDRDKIYYIADYKYFKGEKQIISSDNLKIYIKEYQDSLGTVQFKSGQKVIETVLKTDLLLLKDICKSIDNYYNNAKRQLY